jgi:hypothetical protein
MYVVISQLFYSLLPIAHFFDVFKTNPHEYELTGRKFVVLPF